MKWFWLKFTTLKLVTFNFSNKRSKVLKSRKMLKTALLISMGSCFKVLKKYELTLFCIKSGMYDFRSKKKKRRKLRRKKKEKKHYFQSVENIWLPMDPKRRYNKMKFSNFKGTGGGIMGL